MPAAAIAEQGFFSIARLIASSKVTRSIAAGACPCATPASQSDADGCAQEAARRTVAVTPVTYHGAFRMLLTTTYSTGMNARFRNVDAIMPPATAVPTECRASRPAPVANTSGMTPRMKASDVIRIGRSRMRAASTAASAIVSPRPRSCSANSTIENAVLRRQADQHDQTDLAVHIVDQPAAPLREQRAQNASGTDSRMMNGSVMLSYCAGERQVDEQQAQAEDHRRLAARLDLLERQPRPRVASCPAAGCGPTALHRLIAWPELKPGAAEPLISAERNRL